MNATKISNFMTNSCFPQLIQESDPIEKKTLAKWSEFSLIPEQKKGLCLVFFTSCYVCVLLSLQREVLLKLKR